MYCLIVWLVLLVNSCFAQAVVYPGGGGSSESRCVTKARESGNCKKFLECPAAREDIDKGIYPTICSYGSGGIRSISVCCPNRDTSLPTSDHFAKYSDVCGRVSSVIVSSGNRGKKPLPPLAILALNTKIPIPIHSLSRNKRQFVNLKLVERLRPVESNRPVFLGKKNLPSFQGFLELLSEEKRKNSAIPAVQVKPVLKAPIKPSIPPPVVGGEDAVRNAWPWMVLFGEREGTGYNWFCGGALITDRHILTAAHCFTTISKPDVVRLGEHDVSQTGESPHIDVQARAVYRHDRFSSPAVENDIAIVKLRSPVTFSQYIRPICMPLSDVTPASVDTRGTITGWGTLSFGGRKSDILQQVSVPIVDKKQCQTAYRRSHLYTRMFPQGFPNYLFCASEEQGGKDSCQGDSGGPFMINDGSRFRVAGIVSAGQGCGSRTYPGLYTWVFPYMEWMQETVTK